VPSRPVRRQKLLYNFFNKQKYPHKFNNNNNHFLRERERERIFIFFVRQILISFKKKRENFLIFHLIFKFGHPWILFISFI
jgi:hypothetical protein